jgi:hypothetical protein
MGKALEEQKKFAVNSARGNFRTLLLLMIMVLASSGWLPGEIITLAEGNFCGVHRAWMLIALPC